jgi:CspA family cold shock protein
MTSSDSDTPSSIVDDALVNSSNESNDSIVDNALVSSANDSILDKSLMSEAVPVGSSAVPGVTEPAVLEEVVEKTNHGTYTGQVKWFSGSKGFGFVTINDGDQKGKDIFVHHSGIKPANSNYRTLQKGEYVNFNITNGQKGLQGIEITGINGGPLMCDIVMGTRRVVDYPPPPPPPSRTEWQTVPRRGGGGASASSDIRRGPAGSYAGPQNNYAGHVSAGPQGSYAGHVSAGPQGHVSTPPVYNKTAKPVKNYNKYNKATRHLPATQ